MELPKEPLQCPQIRISLEDSLPSQTEIICNGIPVTFPYPPYQSQVEYMTAVTTACESSKNAMIESPTGTGKTLSLLCASLGWLKQKRATCPEMNYPRIMYTSRTHAQLAQAVRELKKTIYRPRMCVVSSRDHACVNPEANKYQGSQLNLICSRLRKTSRCPYAKGSKERLQELKDQIMDLEEFSTACKKIHWCPFFAARELIPVSDLLFFPYNYVLDVMYHSMFRNLQYTNSVLIFDEGHNVQKVAEDAWSFDLSVGWLKDCVKELSEIKKIKESLANGESIYDNLAGEAKNISLEELQFLEYPVVNLIRYLQKEKNLGKEGVTFEGKMILDYFLKSTAHDPAKTGDGTEVKGLENGLSLLNAETYMKILANCTELLASQSQGAWLVTLFQTFDMIFEFMRNEKQVKVAAPFQKSNYSINSYKLLLFDSCDEKCDKKKKEQGEYRSLQAYCFNPGLSFLVLAEKKPRSVILTSGTLTPMDIVETDLKIPFEIKLVQGHIIDESQVLLQIVTRDCSNYLFNFNYANRSNLRQLKNLGTLLAEICAETPGGVLIFFPSYYMLNDCCSHWKADSTIQTIESQGKPVFQEETGSAKNILVVKEYRQAIKKHEKGAVFFAVCRGKIGEGLDFAGDEARTAIVIGIPFPSATSQRVLLKREYLNQHHEELHMNGQTWYTQEAMRAVNQCLGRTVRNRHDYGALILIDQRYSSRWLKDRLSGWIVKNAKVVEKTEKVIDNLKEFFKTMNDRFRHNRPTSAKAQSFSRKLTDTNSTSEDDTESSVKKKRGVDDFSDLMLMALGEPLFSELMGIFKNYREGKLKSTMMVAEYSFSCFKEAMRKASDCRKGYVKTALIKSALLVNAKDKEDYEMKLAELISKDV